MPIQPTGFDRAFRALGIDFATLRQCSWKNYATYNQTFAALRPLIEVSTGLKNVSPARGPLILLGFLELFEAGVERFDRQGGGPKARGTRPQSVIVMRLSIENTVDADAA
jgi:hypothetical protein